MHESVFKQYYRRLKREAILKSLLWGLAFGVIAAFIVGFATWMSYFKGFFLTLGIFAGVTAIVSVAVYFIFFKPSARDVARRIDALGLEERMITMLELEKDESYMAMRQREDAKQSLSDLGGAKMKFALSLTLTLLLSVGGFFGVAATTVTGLSDFGVIPSGAQLIDEAKGRSPKNYFEVNYIATNGGEIFGEAQQKIVKNGSTETVIATPKDGFRFYRWTDGYPYPARSDSGITENITFTAWFLPITADEDEETPDGDEATDQPSEDGNDSDDEQPAKPGVDPPNYDYVYDWTIKYKDVFGDYYAEIIELLAQDGELTEEERKFIETYLNTIK